MAVIQDLVLIFCPTMHSVQQRKLKLLMLVLYDADEYVEFSPSDQTRLLPILDKKEGSVL